MEKYDHKKIEAKWQERYLSEKTFSPDIKNAKKPFYNLMMFPYPSAEGLHVGNMYAFTGADVYGRFQRMRGYDVLEPIGLDGFGIHSENFAIKVGRHPKEHSEISQKNFYKQLHMIGDSYDWDRTLETYDPKYYKWTQWLFVQMFKAGLAYKDKAMVNWCPQDKTVVSDEQVEGGKCERCGSEVTKREMSSWFFRITKYADRLLDNIDMIKWPEKIKIAQRSWIGKTKGLNIDYPVEGNDLKITVWTKFWETVFGTTFLVLAPEHSLISQLKIPKAYKKDVDEYVKTSLSKSEDDRKNSKEKTGVFTGLYATNQVNGQKVPVWIADYVLASVGTGAVMGVPAHDKRDFDFAKKYHFDIVQVVSYDDKEIDEKVKNAEISYEGEGKLINSGKFDGLSSWGEGKSKMADWMIENKFASWLTTYHLRDWGISRQRYWGPPIPMIYCEHCASNSTTHKDTVFKGMPGWFPVEEKDLPVLLPNITDFKPKGDGTSPLHNAPDAWKKVECPNCGSLAERELNVSDTFLDSSWYFLAYPNLGTEEWKGTTSPLNKEITKKWLPVNTYIGGAEHAVLHLLYARFVTMFLKDQGYLDFEEPFPFLYGHGLIIKDGAKMSKSKGNVVNPDEHIDKFGADTLRMYLMFLGPYDQGGDFRDSGIEGMSRFLGRVWRLFDESTPVKRVRVNLQTKLHLTIKGVTEDIGQLKYNVAIAKIMELVNFVTRDPSLITHDCLETLALLLAPFAPHMMEEVWVEVLRMPFSIHKAPWPTYEAKYIIQNEVSVAVQVNGKVRASLNIASRISNLKSEVENLAKQEANVAKWLEGNTIKKTIFIPGKVINFVI